MVRKEVFLFLSTQLDPVLEGCHWIAVIYLSNVYMALWVMVLSRFLAPLITLAPPHAFLFQWHLLSTVIRTTLTKSDAKCGRLKVNVRAAGGSRGFGNESTLEQQEHECGSAVWVRRHWGAADCIFLSFYTRNQCVCIFNINSILLLSHVVSSSSIHHVIIGRLWYCLKPS